MNSLTIQILVLIASFLFYRILRSGFDSWTAVLLDFGVVIFLFGLQYFLQKNKSSFPAGELSRLFGVSFPDKLNLTDDQEIQNIKNNSRLMLMIKAKEDLYLEANQKSIVPIQFISQDQNNLNEIKILKSGFYILQCSIHTDQVSYHAKLSIVGSKNHFDKSIHQGENSFILYLTGMDNIHLEIENGIINSMILDQTSFCIVEL